MTKERNPKDACSRNLNLAFTELQHYLGTHYKAVQKDEMRGTPCHYERERGVAETLFTEEQMQDENAQVMLSQKEREVVLLAVEGLTTAEIAHTLKVSPSTIKVHLLKIYRKSGVKRRVQLVKLAEAL